ncbi:unnamed protein product [Heligmosomoides polygyrus]|uniref:DUF1534 domain-containing protein n=1 Tax=Heligmosomoides polygyrus TaxID=6339 RepID=A0A183GK00_HELPZ|nr:unnamed protein product [Heligmosomoides polygyrus]
MRSPTCSRRSLDDNGEPVRLLAGDCAMRLRSQCGSARRNKNDDQLEKQLEPRDGTSPRPHAHKAIALTEADNVHPTWNHAVDGSVSRSALPRDSERSSVP